MSHKGEIIEKIVRNVKIPMQRVADLSNLSRKQIYNLFTMPEIAPETILKLGKAINHDFSQEFPEIKKLYHIYPEYIPEELRVEEGRELYLRRVRTPIVVDIDGSDETLNLSMEKLRRFNETLKNL